MTCENVAHYDSKTNITRKRYNVGRANYIGGSTLLCLMFER